MWHNSEGPYQSLGDRYANPCLRKSLIAILLDAGSRGEAVCANCMDVTYRRKVRLDPDVLRAPLSGLLGWEVRRLTTEYQDGGFSGSVYRLRVEGYSPDRAEHRLELILKPERSGHEFAFYRDVLRPLELSFPRIYGVVPWEGRRLLVMEYVPHELLDWNDEHRYRRAVAWLARKDAAIQANLERIAALPYVPPFTAGGPERLAALRCACSEGLAPFLDHSLATALEEGQASFAHLGVLLRQAPLTLVHNDFQMLNLLFGTEAHRGQLYVIDWTFPMIGSVCLDLAKLLLVAPEALAGELVRRYEDARGHELPEAVLRAARVHVGMSLLEWAARALREGQGHAVYTPQLERIAEEVIAYLGQ